MKGLLSPESLGKARVASPPGPRGDFCVADLSKGWVLKNSF